MATTTELEELVAKLTADASSYLKTLDEARAKTESTTKSIDGAIKKTEETFSSSVMEFGRATIDFSGKVIKSIEDLTRYINKTKELGDAKEVTGKKLDEFGKKIQSIGNELSSLSSSIKNIVGDMQVVESFDAFSKQDKSIQILSAAIKGNGNDVQNLTTRYSEFAQEIQNTTKHSAVLATDLVRKAEAQGVTGESAKRAARNALILADSTGKSIEEVARSVIALENGITTSIYEFIPSVMKYKDETDKVAEAHRVLNANAEILIKTGETASGKIDRLTNSLFTLKASIGQILATAIGPFIEGAMKFTNWLNQAPIGFKIVAATVMVLTAGLLALTAALTATIIVVGAAITAYTTITSVISLATIGAIAFKVALLGVAGVIGGALVYGAYQAIAALSGLTDEYKKLDDELERSNKLLDKFGQRKTQETDKILKGVKETVDKRDRRVLINTELAKATKETIGYQSAVSAATKRVQELDKWINILGDGSTLEVAKKELEDLKKRGEFAQDRVERLQKELAALHPPDAEIRKFNEELKEQIATFGMTNEEVKIYKLKLEEATDSMLEFTYKLIRQKESLDDIGKSIGDVSGIMRSLGDKVVTLNINNRQLTETELAFKKLSIEKDRINNVFNLEVRANGPQILKITDEIKELDNHIRNLREGKKDLELKLDEAGAIKQKEILQKQLQEAKNWYAANKVFADKATEQLNIYNYVFGRTQENYTDLLVLERQKKLLDDAEELTKRFRKPIQVYQDEVTELQRIYLSGALSQEVYNSALKETGDKFIDAERKARGLRNEIEKIQNVKFGSLEAKDRIDDFLNKMKEQNLELNKLKNAYDTNPGIRLTESKREIESKAYTNILEYMGGKKLKEISEGFFNPLKEGKIPFVNPLVTTKEPPLVGASIDRSVSSKSTVVSDMKADKMVEILKSIDETLLAIKKTELPLIIPTKIG